MPAAQQIEDARQIEDPLGATAPRHGSSGHVPPTTVQGVLPIDIPAVRPTRRVTELSGQPRPVVALGHRIRSASVDPMFARQPTSSEALPDPAEWATRFVQAVAECLAGARPVTQLIRWTTAELFTGLQRRAAVAARVAAASPAVVARPTVVRSTHICHVADGVAEATVILWERGRARAVAVRLEGLDGRWQATAIETG